MDELLEILLEHKRRYPQLTAVDLVKLVYQNHFGSGHFITDESASLKRLEEEVSQLEPGENKEMLFESIGNGLYRLNLRFLGSNLPLATVNRFFVLTAQEKRGDMDSFKTKLELVLQNHQDEDLESYLDTYEKAGYPAVHHSDAYKKYYAPSYRLVSSDFALYFSVFKQIETLFSAKQRILVAVDGRSGAGKSHLSQLLHEVYDCPVISMDHFFLRPEQRSKKRMQEPGGNVDYERFKLEVTDKLRGNAPFRYQVYDCQTNTFSPSELIEPHKLIVVEGSYSHHPLLVDDYDLKIFLTVPASVQERRILKRNGPVMLPRFKNEWIPLEELYFSALQIEEQSDLSLETQ